MTVSQVGTGNQILGDRRQRIEPNTKIYSRKRESRFIKRLNTPLNRGAGQLRAEIDLRGWRDSILTGRIYPG